MDQDKVHAMIQAAIHPLLQKIEALEDENKKIKETLDKEFVKKANPHKYGVQTPQTNKKMPEHNPVTKRATEKKPVEKKEDSSRKTEENETKEVSKKKQSLEKPAKKVEESAQEKQEAKVQKPNPKTPNVGNRKEPGNSRPSTGAQNPRTRPTTTTSHHQPPKNIPTPVPNKKSSHVKSNSKVSPSAIKEEELQKIENPYAKQDGEEKKEQTVQGEEHVQKIVEQKQPEVEKVKSVSKDKKKHNQKSKIEPVAHNKSQKPKAPLTKPVHAPPSHIPSHHPTKPNNKLKTQEVKNDHSQASSKINKKSSKAPVDKNHAAKQQKQHKEEVASDQKKAQVKDEQGALEEKKEGEMKQDVNGHLEQIQHAEEKVQGVD